MTDPHPPPRLGAVFGHYRLESVLGVGGMGTVYLATDQRLGRQVAFKVLLGHDAASPSFRQRFQREATVLARLDSPHVISILDHGEHQGWAYIVTQVARGGDLSRQIATRGALPPRLAATICAQVADALVAAHAVGVVHRDVKPANVLLRDERLDRMHVYLCDFGVAHTEATGLTTAGSIAGTWNYLAPERTEGEPGTPASDLYAVGCLLWEALTGRPPYAGSDVEVAMAHIEAPVPQLLELSADDDFAPRANEVLRRTMAKDPADRYGSAAELREALRSIGGGLPTPTSSSLLLLPAPRRRRTALAWSTGAATAVAAAVLAALLWPGGAPDRPAADPTGTTTSDAPGPTEPTREPVEIITGDLDADGLGDFATLTEGRAWLFRNAGRSFDRPVQLPPLGFQAVTGDVDADGLVDYVSIRGGAPAVDVVTFTGAGRTVRSVAVAPDLGPLVDVVPMVGDVDGDGNGDLVLISEAEGRIVFTVSRGKPDGSFRLSRTWYRGETLGGTANHAWAMGDLTGDGLGDIVHEVEESLGERPARLQVFASDGEVFAPAGRETKAAEPNLFGIFRAADFDGDGVDELGYLDAGIEAVVWEWDGEQLLGREWLAVDLGTYYGVRHASVSDVDGDGDDDWCFVDDEDKLRVLIAEDGRFRPGWRAVQLRADRIENGTLDPVEFEGY